MAVYLNAIDRAEFQSQVSGIVNVAFNDSELSNEDFACVLDAALDKHAHLDC